MLTAEVNQTMETQPECCVLTLEEKLITLICIEINTHLIRWTRLKPNKSEVPQNKFVYTHHGVFLNTQQRNVFQPVSSNMLELKRTSEPLSSF